MNINLLNKLRTSHYVALVVLVVIFTACIYSINFIYPKKEDPNKKKENEKIKRYGRFFIPFGSLFSFFAACVVVAKLIALGSNEVLSTPRDQYSGIIFLFIIGFILTIMNLTVLKERSIPRPISVIIMELIFKILNEQYSRSTYVVHII